MRNKKLYMIKMNLLLSNKIKNYQLWMSMSKVIQKIIII